MNNNQVQALVDELAAARKLLGDAYTEVAYLHGKTMQRAGDANNDGTSNSTAVAIRAFLDKPQVSTKASSLTIADVNTLSNWAVQVEQLSTSFWDERSLLCQQAAVLLRRIVHVPACDPDRGTPPLPTSVSPSMFEAKIVRIEILPTQNNPFSWCNEHVGAVFACYWFPLWGAYRIVNDTSNNAFREGYESFRILPD